MRALIGRCDCCQKRRLHEDSCYLLSWGMFCTQRLYGVFQRHLDDLDGDLCSVLLCGMLNCLRGV